MEYRIVEYDEPNEWWDAVLAAKEFGKPWVLLCHPEGEWEKDTPERILEWGWDNRDLVYPRVIFTDGGHNPMLVQTADEWCATRHKAHGYPFPIGLLWAESLGGGSWDEWVDGLSPQQVKADPYSTAYVPHSFWREPRNRDVDAKATFYFQATPATAYLRCVMPARYLPGLATSDLMWAEDEAGMVFPEQRGPAAVLQFAGDRMRALAQLGMQNAGIRTLIEVDDNYLVDAGVIRKKANWGKKIGDMNHTIEGHVTIVKKADGVIVTTDHLADQYRPVNPNVFVCPNQIDPLDWPEPGDRDDDTFRIGWFSSGSHEKDTPLVWKALDWASRQPGVRVITMGHRPPGLKLSHISWVNDLAVYRKAMSMLDVGLAPVVPTPWSLCRSDVKYLEYSMGGAMSIVSDLAPYATATTALKAKTAKDFERLVRWAVENKDEARALGAESRKHVLENRTVQGNIGRWEDAVAV